MLEFKGQYYDKPEKNRTKLVQKPHMPLILKGFYSIQRRIIENDLDGWLDGIGGVGPFAYVESCVNILKNELTRANENDIDFIISLIATTDIFDTKSQLSFQSR